MAILLYGVEVEIVRDTPTVDQGKFLQEAALAHRIRAGCLDQAGKPVEAANDEKYALKLEEEAKKLSTHLAPGEVGAATGLLAASWPHYWQRCCRHPCSTPAGSQRLGHCTGAAGKMEVVGTGPVGRRTAQAAAAAGNARAGCGRERRYLRWWKKGAGGAGDGAVGDSGAGAARRFGNPSGRLRSLGASYCLI